MLGERHRRLKAEAVDQAQHELNDHGHVVARREGLWVDVAAVAGLSAQGQKGNGQGEDAGARKKSFHVRVSFSAVLVETNLVSV